MTPSEKITELKALLAEAKEALMNRDPHTREKECYDSGHVPCQCTLCKINEALIGGIEKTYFEEFEEGKMYNLTFIDRKKKSGYYRYVSAEIGFVGLDIYTKELDSRACKMSEIATARTVTSMDF